MSLKNIFSSFSKKNNNKDTSLKNTDVLVAGRQLPNGDELTVGIDVEDFKSDILSEAPAPDLTGYATETYVDTEVAAIPPSSTLFGLDRTVTDFNFKAESVSSSANATGNRAFYYVFRLDGSCKVINMGVRINTLSSTVGAVCYAALYKYDIDTDSINLVAAMPSEINIDSTVGFTGFNFVNFPSALTLEPGIYFTRVIPSHTIQFAFTNQVDNPIGIVGAGTNGSKYYGFTDFPVGGYDFGSTPTNIALNTLTKETNLFSLPGKAFFTITK